MGLTRRLEKFEKVGEWDTYVEYFEYDCDECGWNFSATQYEPDKGCCPHCGHDNGPYSSEADDDDNLKAEAAALAVWAFNVSEFEDF